MNQEMDQKSLDQHRDEAQQLIAGINRPHIRKETLTTLSEAELEQAVGANGTSNGGELFGPGLPPSTAC